MGEEIYNKTVIDLSAKEMMLIYDRYQIREYPMPMRAGGAVAHNPRSQSPFTIVKRSLTSKRSQSTSKSSTMLTAERIHL